MTSLYAAMIGVLMGVVVSAPVKENEDFDISMPGVQPSNPDTYLCFPKKLDKDALYLTGFDTHANMSVAHHVLLYGCTDPGNEDATWNCGEMASGPAGGKPGPVCKSGATILYAWAMDAPKLSLPEGVAFKVGGDTEVQWLVLQVHYKNVDPFIPPNNDHDTSGVKIQATTEPQPKRAGIYLLGTGGEIAPESTVYMETACSFDDGIVVHPFAYRAHAHSLGEVVSGYRIRDGKWEEIGRVSPKLPETFYDVTHPGMTVRDGDIIAARCTMVNPKSQTVAIGNTQNDEMCNFYMMYWVDGDQTMKENYCFSDGPPHYSWSKSFSVENAPADISVVPGTNKVLKATVDTTEESTEEATEESTEDKINEEDVYRLLAELIGDDYQQEQEQEAEEEFPRMPYGYGDMQEEEYQPDVVSLDEGYQGYNPTYQRSARAQQDTYDLLRDIEEYYENMD